MIVTAVKSRLVEPGKIKLLELLDESIESLNEKSVVAITSKIVAMCEGRTVPIEKANKSKLVRKESDYYLPEALSKHNFSFTIVNKSLVPMAGIDESNGGGNYILWPKDPLLTAEYIRRYFLRRFDLKNVGVIITDSTARPLHWGTEGIAIGYSGFLPTNNYIGKEDLFGRPFKISNANIADSFAAAAVSVMGEGAEQTPIAVIEDTPFVKFQQRAPTKKEIDRFYVSRLEDDLFAPFLNSVEWQKGGRKP